MRRVWFAGATLLLVLGLMLFVGWPSSGMASRELHCAQQADPRARQVCVALQEHMEWTWLGHAIVSPGWRVTFHTVREFYCGLSVTAADAITLESLRKSATDWRLQDGAQELIWLLDGAAQPPASIFNPAQSQYLLKHGCG